MEAPMIVRERNGAQAVMTAVRPDPPDSDFIVRRTTTWRREYHFAGYEDGVPVYEAKP